MFAVRLLLLCAATALVCGQQNRDAIRNVLNNRCVKLVSVNAKANNGKNTANIIKNCASSLRHLSKSARDKSGKDLVYHCVGTQLSLVRNKKLDTNKLRDIISQNPRELGESEKRTFLQKLQDCDSRNYQLVQCMDYTCPGLFPNL